MDKQLNNAGWNIVPRDEYIPNSTVAVKEAIMSGNYNKDKYNIKLKEQKKRSIIGCE